MLTCIVEGCEKPANVPGAARGYCIAHYNRVRRTGDPQCNIVGCDKPIGKYGEWGFCAHHAKAVLT